MSRMLLLVVSCLALAHAEVKYASGIALFGIVAVVNLGGRFAFACNHHHVDDVHHRQLRLHHHSHESERVQQENIFEHHVNAHDHNHKVGSDSSFCGAEEQSVEQMEKIQANLRLFREQQKEKHGGKRRVLVDVIEIPVHFHVITGSRGEGNVPEDRIMGQMQKLNDSFMGTPFQFVLKNITRPTNTRLFYLLRSSDNDYVYVQSFLGKELHVGDKTTLNIYSTLLAPRVLGFASFPSSNDGVRDGIFLDHCAVWGGNCTAVGENGKVAVHEVGHWLGLFHVFQGGCNSEHGDYVSDTAPQAKALFECGDQNSCPDFPGPDPTDNYMGYAWECLSEFTPGQIERMHDQYMIYRNGTQPCAENEGILSIELQLDADPEQNQWYLAHANGQLLSISDFGRFEEGRVMNSQICVPYNAPLYFAIDDSFGNGLTSSETSYFRLRVDGKLIKDDRTFGELGAAGFTMVNSDRGCPPDQSLIQIDLLLDSKPSDISWSIIEEVTGAVVYKEPDYEIFGGDYYYQRASIWREMCLPSGEYMLSLVHSGDNSQDEELLFYHISVDGTSIGSWSLIAGASHDVRFEVGSTTASPSSQPSSSQSMKPSPAPFPSIYINAGHSGNILDSEGREWLGDISPTEGLVSYSYSQSNAHADPNVPITPVEDYEAFIYQSERWHSSDLPEFTYVVSDLPPGEYLARIHFAEIFFGLPKQRVFDVFVEGEKVSEDLDMVAAGGKGQAVVVDWEGLVDDGSLTIELVRQVQNPKISGIEIHQKVGSPSAPSAPTTPAPTAYSPSSSPSVALALNTDGYAWQIVDTSPTNPTQRHEACFVMVNGLAYLIGGRGSNPKPTDMYNPATQRWTAKTGPPIELHHMQCVVVGNEVWIVSAWTGGFPYEQNVDLIYIYNTITDTWRTKQGLPAGRRRGGAAAVLYQGEIYVSHGNIGGHGEHATSLGWLDKYNIANDQWITNLPTAPNPRDHTGGAIVNGELCVAAGRDGGFANFFNQVVVETDCYNFATGVWRTAASIPQGRAGSSYGQTCDGKLMVAGGEGFGFAYSNVDVFDGSSWTAAGSLVVGRHGSGLAFSCECNQVHIASGSIGQGGGGETTTTETYFFGDTNVPCQGGIQPAPPVSFPSVYINAGSSANIIDSKNREWVGDMSASAQDIVTYTESNAHADQSVAITPVEDYDVTIYQSERWHSSNLPELTYTFPTLPSGEYLVRLHFAEIFFTAVNQRVFDVFIEGNKVSDNLDLIAKAGGKGKAAIVEWKGLVNDGSLTIGLVREIQNPKISGIEIHQVTGSPTPPSAPKTPPPTTPAPSPSPTDAPPKGKTLSLTSIYINAGSTANIIDSKNRKWVGDMSTSAQGIVSYTQSNAHAEQSVPITPVEDYDAFIYQTERWDPAGLPELSYTFPTLPSGEYLVRLHFAEIFFGLANQRVFDVFVEGNKVSENLDIVVAAGGKGQAIIVDWEGTIDDGSLTIELAREVENPKISGIEIHQKTMPSTAFSPIRINVGGGAFRGSSGKDWLADGFYTNGNVESTGLTIRGVPAQDYPLYQTGRWSADTVYSIEVPNGMAYIVTLYFADIWEGTQQQGQRVFDVLVEGVVVLSNFDIVKEAGAGYTAYSTTDTISTTVEDGELTIEFKAITQNPKISGIEINLVGSEGRRKQRALRGARAE